MDIRTIFSSIMLALGLAFESRERQAEIHARFRPRPRQVEILAALLRGEDVVGVLPTGYGKSLLYQIYPFLPGVEGLALVVSPLRGLVRDQIRRCQDLGLKAEELQMEGRKQLEGLDQLTKVLFSSPEAVVRNRATLQRMGPGRVGLLVYDEAHCISCWGIGDERRAFREEFAETKFLRTIFNVPTLCLSATMDQKVLDDIKSNLQLGVSEDRKLSLIGEAVDRPNIFFQLEAGKISRVKAFDWITKGIRTHKTSFPKTVIFVQTPSAASELYDCFMGWLGWDMYWPDSSADENRMVTMYTGQIGKSHQDFVMETFRHAESVIRVVICTVAFGMGMDIPDIRNVAHWGPCDKLVAYWQEVGRIGRDNDSCTAYIYPSLSMAKDVFQPFRDENFNQCIRYYFLSKLCPNGIGEEYVRSLLSRPSCKCKLNSCSCSHCICCSVCRRHCKCRNRKVST